jgi:hypothetical protein
MAALAHVMRLEPPTNEFAARRDQSKVLGAMNLGSHPGGRSSDHHVRAERAAGLET